MTSDTHWKCPSCGQIYGVDDPSCPVCRITRDHRDRIGKTSVERSIEKPREAVEVRLPYVIQEASFNLPTADGKSLWTGGCVAAGEAGLFLLGAKDGLDPQEVARSRPAASGALGPTSLFLAPADVLRLVHERLIGFWLETSLGKIPLRLPKGGWEELDALCDHHGIRHT
jgi:hypothetical protein